MTEVVVDTDVVSFIFKNHPFGSRYDPELTGRITLISFMTVAEIERWTLQRRCGFTVLANPVLSGERDRAGLRFPGRASHGDG